jgi:hypothetical protein
MAEQGYKIIKSARGNRYSLNGRLVKAADVPEEIQMKLDAQDKSADVDMHVCIFCGGKATETRFIQLQTIALCSEDFYAKSVAQIVNRLKEVFYESKNKKAEEAAV